jgi:hypothetical protein
MVLGAMMAVTGGAHALEYVPVYNASLMGGQYFFKGQRASLSGNASAVAAPMLVKDDQWSFIPMFASNYQGTKGINDGVAAGTLFQQQMDHRISFTAIDSIPNTNWKLKPSLSYKRVFMKETTDEEWGKGLFDYDKLALGFEAENVYMDPFSYRLGFDVYKVRFVNFQSLESQSGLDPLGNPLGRENAGTNVLDTNNYQLSASISRPYPYDDPKVALSASYSLLLQDYGNDPIVDERGQFQAGSRKDFVQTLGASVGYPRKLAIGSIEGRLNSSFGLNFAVNTSNQNTFDVAQARFVPNTYSYIQFGLGPSASYSWGPEKTPTSVGMSIRYTRTMYQGRLAQDGNGLYVGERQRQNRYSVGLNYAYPMGGGLYLKAQTNLLWVRSNNLFEKTYAYNYTTANYLMGFSWEY